MRQAYYEEKMEDETRIRRIYHDMKNHLLVLENAVPGAGAAVPGAENVPAGGRPGVRASIEHLQQQIGLLRELLPHRQRLSGCHHPGQGKDHPGKTD